MKHSEASLTDALAACAEKMRAANCSANCIAAILRSVCQVRQAGAGIIPEAAIAPVGSLPRVEDLPQRTDEALLKKLAVIKLNGGRVEEAVKSFEDMGHRVDLWKGAFMDVGDVWILSYER